MPFSVASTRLAPPRQGSLANYSALAPPKPQPLATDAEEPQPRDAAHSSLKQPNISKRVSNAQHAGASRT
eukprot:2556451-Pyramimonas_sp.AAC.1